MSEVQGDVICNQSFFSSDFTSDFTDFCDIWFHFCILGMKWGHVRLFCNVLFEKKLIAPKFYEFMLGG